MAGKCQFCSSQQQPLESCPALGEHPQQFTPSASAAWIQASPSLWFLFWSNQNAPDRPQTAATPHPQVGAPKFPEVISHLPLLAAGAAMLSPAQTSRSSSLREPSQPENKET